MSVQATVEATKEVILAYWKSWQIKDWEMMRRSLADSLDFGGQAMPRDAFVEFCQNGTPWQEVELIDSLFNADGGALIYEGTDTKNGSRIRVAEIVRVEGGKVAGANACFGTGTPPQ